MRTSFLILMLVALVLCAVPASAQGPETVSFSAAGTEAEHVQAFLKTLQAAVAVDNRLKVASLVKFPIQAWIGDETVTLKNETDFLARYSQIFDPATKRSIAEARIESLMATKLGVLIDHGRFCCLPDSGRPKVLKLVAINRPE